MRHDMDIIQNVIPPIPTKNPFQNFMLKMMFVKAIALKKMSVSPTLHRHNRAK